MLTWNPMLHLFVELSRNAFEPLHRYMSVWAGATRPRRALVLAATSLAVYRRDRQISC